MTKRIYTHTRMYTEQRNEEQVRNSTTAHRKEPF